MATVAATIGVAAPAWAGAQKTTYPVVFAHGMAGFDNILGVEYWGDDYGTFVGDPCDELLEVYCNGDVDRGQKAFVAQVQPFHNSEVRGLDLANDTESFMATAGASYVNLVGHSQGGFDIRKAAKLLKQRKGYAAVKVLLSISSPHRGSPTAKHILGLGPGVTSVVSAFANYFGDSVYQPGNDIVSAGKQLVFDDFSASDGVTTGAKAFNVTYPISTSTAARHVSLMTAQHGISVNPAFFLLQGSFLDIDGDGYCVGDCDNDGAAGKGDGTRYESDDDGLVGINSQQMGYRLRYTEILGVLDTVTNDSNVAYSGDLNAPTSAQMTSSSSVVNQDHIDVIGVGPDTFDENEFYAAIFEYIGQYD
ncbi:lactonizing lipase [Chondromyces apiculatus DSM 436]|uniref:Lactonizing lipase n=2 Tax=Chondromyces apiculatus TaxID=51 RepID=A0A017TC03_9BACT|nr:lactonizing lipase [Chondromyces apiculatus DSM 436]